MTAAYIGIGSNLDGPVSQVRRALDALAGLPETNLTAVSTLYYSPPMGPPDQPRYVNAVAALETSMDARHLLAALHRIEDVQARIRQQRWGPRTLDLDLLVFGTQLSKDPNLLLPHPGVSERAFVLVPLAEIAPDLMVPGLGRVRHLLQALPVEARSSLIQAEG